MKLWMVFIGLLFTPALQAQVPLYYYPYLPYSSASYYPMPLYSNSYYPQPYYSQSAYGFGQYPMSETNDAINTLTRQIQQLNDEIARLQAQVQLAQTQQLQTQRIEATVYSSDTPAIPVTLILKNGKKIVAQGYAVAGQTLWIVTPSGFQKMPLSALNVAATQRANTTREVLFGSLSGN